MGFKYRQGGKKGKQRFLIGGVQGCGSWKGDDEKNLEPTAPEGGSAAKKELAKHIMEKGRGDNTAEQAGAKGM